MKILIIGCEHSGTRWLSHNIVIHPDVEEIIHCSVPTDGSIGLDWVIPNIEDNKYDGAVIVTRDSSCLRRSQESSPHSSFKKLVENNQFYSKDLIENWVIAGSIVMKSCKDNNVPYAMTCYESLVQFLEQNLRKIFRQLNINEDNYKHYQEEHTNRSLAIPWDQGTTRPIDGNKKYIKDKQP